MKKYVKPNVEFILLDKQDVCTASGGGTVGNQTENVGGNLNATFENYDFSRAWL
ncbi:MAG: hypothetical protein IIX01_02475 [Clostridia bacterium]|nr:hypothetical protein [Clostridia bacterium]